MHEVPDSSVDLVVTSPPYWNIISYGDPRDLGSISDKDEFFKELEKVFKECYRVMKPGARIAINWADPMMYKEKQISIVPDMLKTMERCGFYLAGKWIWKKYKSGAGIVRLPIADYAHVVKDVEPIPLFNWEYIWVWKKPGEKIWVRDFSRSEWIEYCDGVWWVNSSKESGASEIIPGGAVFPVEIPKRLIKLFTQKYDVVLDPFGGTGTTMLAAFMLKRSCWLYELRKDALEIIKAKVRYGSRHIDEEVNWSVRIR